MTRPNRVLRFSSMTLAAILICVQAEAVAAVRFVDVAAEAGVRVAHDPLGLYPGGVAQQNFYGSGVAWADINRDGWPDLILANGEVGSSVFLNRGDGTFEDGTGWLRNEDGAASTGVALADVDNDGDLDLSMVNYYGEPFFFLGANAAMSEQADLWGMNPLLFGVNDPPPDNWSGPQSMGVSYGDLDRDGFIDIYVANYQADRDMFLDNLQGGYFQQTDWVNDPPSAQGFQPVFWDFDNDGDQDIYVANDFGRNYLFENGGPENDFALTEVAQVYKVSGGAGWPNPSSLSMGLAVGDYDNDLDLDLYVTNYFENALYENVGMFGPAWRFRERALEAGVRYNFNSWGTEFFDADNDGDLDLVLTGGWIPSEPNLDQGRNIDDRFFRNDGGPDWTFTDLTEDSSFGTDQQSGRGLALADYDRDGDLDVAVWYNSLFDGVLGDPDAVYREGHFALYRNDQSETQHWVSLELEGAGEHEPGSGCNRTAIGARVTLTTDLGTQLREVRAGGSFLSQSSLELEFGLGATTDIQEVRVRWVCGVEEVFSGVSADGVYRLSEDAGVAVPKLMRVTQLSAIWTGQGMELSWHHAPWLDVAGIVLERANLGEELLFEPVDRPAELTDRTGRVVDDTAAEETPYIYRVSLDTALGETETTTVSGTSGLYEDIPDRPELAPNWPNPFNPGTTIEFSIPRRLAVRLSIYDMRGRHVKTILDETRDAGEYADVVWDGTDGDGNPMASGTYIYTLHTSEGSQSRSMTLLR